MESAYLIGALTSAFVLLVQSGMLWLQASALRRHGHRSFLLLAIGSALGILYCLTSFPLYLMRISEDTFWALTLGSTALVLVGASLGFVGTALLFRSYAKLAERVGSSSVAGT
ncbi:hypothetical protein [Luteimonas sp. MC1828]|uniref:hypothetical protein n=1 Tax=Luteimonas sp. MC1828 TaxID=2799787 RepID=UPI0018F13B78|nr:hypothetical protein [Luteimonas sp. MC1828]MBJ7575495.1 hypothetical protein [Luteimonas sp. MC1828]